MSGAANKGVARVEAKLDKLYGSAHGFIESKAEAARVARSGSSSTYGELTARGASELLAELRLGRDDVFYDLGSGIGKLVWQAAITTRVPKVVGVELVPSRHEVALGAMARAQALKWKTAKRVEFRRANFLRTPMQDASVAYCCNTAFPDELLRKLVRRLAKGEPGLRLISLMPLDEEPWFELRRMLELDTTWRKRAKVRIYELVRPWGFSRR